MYGNPADADALREEETMRRRDLEVARRKLVEGHPPGTPKGKEAWAQYEMLASQDCSTSRKSQLKE